MAYESLVALQVSDEAGYQSYRDGMTPILEGYGGSFRWDFRISEVLAGESDEPLNRLFILSFPSADAKQAFFTDPAYLEVRGRFFDPAVAAVARLAEYEPIDTAG